VGIHCVKGSSRQKKNDSMAKEIRYNSGGMSVKRRDSMRVAFTSTGHTA
jgi:hypothetical protein